MDEITFQVSRDEESGWLIASWDAPNGSGGITTQGQDLRDLQAQVVDAVVTHFDDGETPQRIRPQHHRAMSAPPTGLAIFQAVIPATQVGITGSHSGCGSPIRRRRSA